MVLTIERAVPIRGGKQTPVGKPASRMLHFPRLVINNGREKEHSPFLFAPFPLANSVFIGSVMTTKTDKANHAQKYLCVDENLGKLVYSYYNGAINGEAAHSFEEHLVICFRCQEVVLKLDDMFEAARADPERWFGPGGLFEIRSFIEAERED